MGDHTAFFYGTLMVPKILYRVCFGTTTPQSHQTQFITIRPALLRNYRRHRVRHADYPGITPTTSSDAVPASVLGTYVTGLTEMDVYRLDCFEGNEYERKNVNVQVLKGSIAKVQADAAKGVKVGESEGDLDEIETQTYVFLDRAGLEEKEWDFEEFKREKMGRWTLERSEEYDDVPDDDGEAERQHDGTGGRGAGGDITRQLESEEVPEQVARAAV